MKRGERDCYSITSGAAAITKMVTINLRLAANIYPVMMANPKKVTK